MPVALHANTGQGVNEGADRQPENVAMTEHLRVATVSTALSIRQSSHRDHSVRSCWPVVCTERMMGREFKVRLPVLSKMESSTTEVSLPVLSMIGSELDVRLTSSGSLYVLYSSAEIALSAAPCALSNILSPEPGSMRNRA